MYPQNRKQLLHLLRTLKDQLGLTLAVSVGTLSPADAVGPPSTVMSGRDTIHIGIQPPQLYGTIDASSSALIHDRQEVQPTNTQGTTLFSNDPTSIAGFKSPSTNSELTLQV